MNDLVRSTAFYDKVMPALGFKRLPNNDRNNIRWANARISFAIRPAADSERGAAHNRYRVGFHHLAFKAKSRVQQHQMVYGALKGRMGGELHALKLQTAAE